MPFDEPGLPLSHSASRRFSLPILADRARARTPGEYFDRFDTCVLRTRGRIGAPRQDFHRGRGRGIDHSDSGIVIVAVAGTSTLFWYRTSRKTQNLLVRGSRISRRIFSGVAMPVVAAMWRVNWPGADSAGLNWPGMVGGAASPPVVSGVSSWRTQQHLRWPRSQTRRPRRGAGSPVRRLPEPPLRPLARPTRRSC